MDNENVEKLNFLEHMIKRLSAESTRVRTHTAELLNHSLRDSDSSMMETDSKENSATDETGLDHVVVKLLILKDSAAAIQSLIKGLVFVGPSKR